MGKEDLDEVCINKWMMQKEDSSTGKSMREATNDASRGKDDVPKANKCAGCDGSEQYAISRGWHCYIAFDPVNERLILR